MRLHYWVALAALLIWIVFSDCPSFHSIQNVWVYLSWNGSHALLLQYLQTLFVMILLHEYHDCSGNVLPCYFFQWIFDTNKKMTRKRVCTFLRKYIFGNSNETETTYAVIIIMLTLWDWMRWILWDGYFLGENWGFCCCVGKSKRK